jgi:hypothetical protein
MDLDTDIPFFIVNVCPEAVAFGASILSHCRKYKKFRKKRQALYGK